MVIGEARFRIVLQANDFRTLVVLHSALVYDNHLYVYLWELGRTQYRRTSTALVLHGGDYRLELLCGLLDQDIDGIPGQCQHLWKGIFSSAHYAFEHCSEQFGSLWGADAVIFCDDGILSFFKREGDRLSHEYVCIAISNIGIADGSTRSWSRSYNYRDDHQIPRFGLLDHFRSATLDVRYHSNISTQCSTGKIRMAHRTQSHDGDY